MFWYRIDFRDNDSRFCEIGIPVDVLKTDIENGELVCVNRSLLLFPKKGPEGKDGMGAAQAKDINPLYMVCNQEYINTKLIKSFGVVDVESNIWKSIAESALGEKHIMTPSKSLLVP